MSHLTAIQLMFGLYVVLGIVALLLYRRLSLAVEVVSAAPQAPLGSSKRIVYGLTFCIDAFGGGFFVQSLLALWLYQNFGISIATAAAILFWSSICSAISYLLAVPISERFGLINTMVWLMSDGELTRLEVLRDLDQRRLTTEAAAEKVTSVFGGHSRRLRGSSG